MTKGGARDREHQFWIGIARAFGGAVFFSLPLLMTMEMWWLGLYMSRLRLVLFMVLMIPVLIGLAHISGFEETTGWLDAIVDAIGAYGVGFVAATIVLFLLNIIDLTAPPRETIGKIALQAIPASFGAILASAQFGEGQEQEEQRKSRVHYRGELFLMAAGAVFLAFNIAPTEEIPLLASRITNWHALALAVASLLMMHGFVYSVGFKGTASRAPGATVLSLFSHYTVPGYAIALLVSAFVLWTFGRYEGYAASGIISQAVVLAFPASLGASAARLIL